MTPQNHFRDELSTAKLGADHPDTLRAMINLSVLYQDRERFDDAEALLKQILRSVDVKLGSNHTDTLSAMNNLAALYTRRGRHDEAMPLFEQVLAARRAKLDPDHCVAPPASLSNASSSRIVRYWRASGGQLDSDPARCGNGSVSPIGQPRALFGPNRGVYGVTSR